MKEVFRTFAQKTSTTMGSARTFIIAVVGVIVWALLGPFFNYSDTWQLAINTITTIITFLMVFIIQNSQNRDAKALHLKLDELIKVTSDARNKLVNVENFSEKEIRSIQEEFTFLKNEEEQHE